MTKMKGFPKNRYELKKPCLYAVAFETGFVKILYATSARDAKIKTLNYESEYGFFKSANKIKPFYYEKSIKK